MGVVDELVDIYPIFQSAGTQAAVDFYQRLKAEVEERAANGIGVIAVKDAISEEFGMVYLV